MTKKEVSLINTSGEILIKLPKEEAQNLIIDLNIALDRHRINNETIVSDKLIVKEREIIERAILLKQKGIKYTHI